MADPSTYRPAPGTIPTDPGVYKFYDRHGVVLYVGKAKNLRQRLNSYFADPASLHHRTHTMVTTAVGVEWTVVQNELESLQLEYTWIKQYDPRFNVKYRDDKSYPWLAVTWSDEVPRVFVGRGTKRRGWRYFGPYGQAWAIRETVDLLLRVFPMRSCSAGTFRNAQVAGRPCLLAHIDKCAAPCVGKITVAEHRNIADDFCSFMNGRSNGLVRRLEIQMKAAAQELDFEKAARLRDDIAALKKATEQNAIVLPDGTDADVIALSEDPLEVAIHIFHVRAGRVQGQRGWVADRTDHSETSDLVEAFCLQLYADIEPGAIPREILVPALPTSHDGLEELLTQHRGAKVEIRVPQRGDKAVLLDTVAKNAVESLRQHKTRRASDLTTRNRALEEIQEALGLAQAPLRIECYDISHTQGHQVVGSMVVFEDGLPRKSEYRRFIIKSFEGSDDVAAMNEVLGRRLRRLADDHAAYLDAEACHSDLVTGAPRKFSYTPALIVVDGGAPQVAAAAQALSDAGMADEIALCGLAKRLEEVWVSGEEYPIILPRTSEGLYLLQRLRDEAHRFAITHHRSRRTKAMVESVLDEVPGLGENRRKALISVFGSVKKLRAASIQEIAAVPGFGMKLATAVHSALSQQEVPESVNMTTGEIIS
ncbi:MAG: excinuclease ABC subunit UvrC [Propionibacteriaceae bacterium]